MDGFREPVITPMNKKPQPQHDNQNANNINNTEKKGKKEGKQQGGGDETTKQPVQNEFEDWCTSALEILEAQVDIPTILTLLRDIESPFEVSQNFLALLLLWQNNIFTLVNQDIGNCTNSLGDRK